MLSFPQQKIHSLYRRWIRPSLSPLCQQRVKLLWTVWGYYHLLTLSPLRFSERVHLLIRILRVDWNVQHAHWPGEMASVIKVIAARRAQPGEVIVEAGCWRGGSTAKLSIIASLLGYKLLVFDSFEGVECQPGNKFSGSYAASISLVKRNVASYGEIDVCEFIPGWFSDTLASEPVQHPVRGAYMDCDLAKGTKEILQGVLPSLVEDGVLCSQDFHIREVRTLLEGEDLWAELNVSQIALIDRYRNLAVFRVESK